MTIHSFESFEADADSIRVLGKALAQPSYCLFKLLQIPGFLISGGFLVLESSFLPAQAAFQKTPASHIESCALRLSHAPDISQQCLKYVDKSVQWTFWQTSLGFQFGRLSRTQWQTLYQHYGSWHHHRTPYDPSRHYDLLDFLPPIIQSLDRHRFISETRSLSPVTDRQLVTNCWGTTYEILRLSQRSTSESPVLFVTEAQPMLNLLRKISTPVTTTIQPGDVLLVYHRHGTQQYLDHTAIAIDQQIIFEKAGTGDAVPYRLIDLDTIRRIWNPQIFIHEWRRPMRRQRLPHPLQQFRVKNPVPQIPFAYTMTYPIKGGKTIYFPILIFPALQQQGSQFRLPPEAYR
jgi:hypothetical protein